jgi:hypothetical protein
MRNLSFVKSSDYRPSNQCSLCFCFINVLVVSCVIFVDNLCYPLSLNLTQQGNPNSTDRCWTTTQGKYGLGRGLLNAVGGGAGGGGVVNFICARLRGGVWSASSFVYQHNIIKECVYTYTVDKVDLQPHLRTSVHSFTSARTLGQLCFLLFLRVTWKPHNQSHECFHYSVKIRISVLFPRVFISNVINDKKMKQY